MSKKSLSFVVVICAMGLALIWGSWTTWLKRHPSPTTSVTSNSERYVITVDYDRNLRDAILVGNYDYIDPRVTEDNFPKGENEKGKKEKSFALYHSEASEDVREMMKKMGDRPATVRELLAFGESNSELQHQFPIVALGFIRSFTHQPNDYALGLDHVGRERNVMAHMVGNWRKNYRFLAVKE